MRVLLLLVLSLAVPFYTFTVASPTELPPEDDGILTSSVPWFNLDGTRAPDHDVVTGSLPPEPPTAEHDPAPEVPPSPVPTQAVALETDSATHKLFPTYTYAATAEPATEGVQTSAPPMEAETTPGPATTGAETIGAVTTATASVTEAATLRAETEGAEPEEAETEGAETSEQEAGTADVVIEDPNSEESGLSSGQVVGIVIGALLAVVIVIAVVVSVFRRMGKYTP